MILKQKWFDRKFVFDLAVEYFPLVVERLRGTPVRLQERVAKLSTEQLIEKRNNSWSIQENIGHLADLEPLWAGRLEDLLQGAKELRPADLTNAATHEANHNTVPIERALGAFSKLRNDLVSRLDNLHEKAVLLSARHPRLGQPMRTIDLAFFVAEHDDHHLARITELIKLSNK